MHSSGMYGSHQRNKTSNNLGSTLTLDNNHSQYVFQNRDDPMAQKYFGSFKGSTGKPYLSKSKPTAKSKCKKRSRNKQMYIGMTSNQSKYTSKFPKGTIQDGNLILFIHRFVIDHC